MINKDLIGDKLAYLSIHQKRISELKANYSIDQFVNEWEVQTSAEREFEIIVQVIIDICTHIISHLSYNPQTSGDCILDLVKEKIIEGDLGQNIVSAIKMRNLIVHQYASINYNIVYDNIDQLISDSRKFTDSIKIWLGLN